MIRTCIVEDEAFLRQSIKKTIESVNPDFFVEGTAGDGEQALDMIQKLQPDVVFLDIRMPIMDGLECLKNIRFQYPHILCIMLTGYSDFEYVQEALRRQAYDYILKPIDQNKLEGLLKKIAEKIHASRKDFQYQYLQSLLTQLSPYKKPSIQEVKNYFLEVSSFSCFYFCEGSYPVNPFLCLDNEKAYCTEKDILTAIFPLLEKREQVWCLNTGHFQEHFLLIGHPDKHCRDIAKTADTFFHKLLRFSSPVTCIYSSNPVPLEALRSLFMDLKYSSYSKTRFAFSSLSDERRIPLPSQKEMGLTPSKIKELQHYASLQQASCFCQSVFSVLDCCETYKCPQSLLFTILKRICEFVVQGKQESIYEEEIGFFISNARTYSELKEQMGALLYEMLQPVHLEGTDAVIASIHQYIEEHFTESLSLKALAELHYISVSYMCTLYKKAYRISPIDDIIRKRIQAAKKLLCSQPDLTIKQISEMVGYSDSYYFSRLFKAVTGMTPSVFRRQ